MIGYEISEVLDVKPAEYFVELTKREKRACKKCEEQGVAAAPLAARIIDKSLVSDRVIIDTLVRKYADHCPLVSAEFDSEARHGHRDQPWPPCAAGSCG